MIRQGDVFWAEAGDERRPVLVVTRSEAVPVLASLVVAPVTRTVRRIPTEVALGPDGGLAEEYAASFDSLQPIRRSFLTHRIGSLGPVRRSEIRAALAALADCSRRRSPGRSAPDGRPAQRSRHRATGAGAAVRATAARAAPGPASRAGRSRG